MPTDQKVNVYTKGLFKDLNESMVSDQMVTHARNAMLSTHKGDSTNYILFDDVGDLIKVKGYKFRGIYTITNKMNGKMYVGSSKYIRKRFVNHLKQLKKGIHYNEHLQKAVNKYGIKNFLFELIEVIDEVSMFSTECFWINMLQTFNPKYGYNKGTPSPNGGVVGNKSCNKSKPRKKIFWSEDSKKAFSLFRKGRYFGNENTSKKAYNTRLINNNGSYYKEGSRENFSRLVKISNSTRIVSQASKDKISHTLRIKNLLNKGCTLEQAEDIIKILFRDNKKRRYDKKSEMNVPFIKAYDIKTQKEYLFNQKTTCSISLGLNRSIFYKNKNKNKVLFGDKYIIVDEYK